VGALAVTLPAAYAAYQAQSQQPGQVASGTATYRRHILPLPDNIADGPGNARTRRPASGGNSDSGGNSASGGNGDNSSRSGQTANGAKPRRPAKAKAAPQAHATGGTTRAPSATHRGGATTRSRQSSGSSTTNLRSAVQQDIDDGNELLAVGQYLVESGYSRAAAAGVASCVDGESGGNPEAVGSGGGGLISWTPISSAAPNSNIITGDAAQDMKTQLADILYYNSTEIGQSLVTQLNTLTDPVAAADFYSENFERPAVTNSDVVPSVAEQIFSQLGGL
jgi:hypothetical protein